LSKLTGCTKGDTIRRIAPRLGKEVEFREPDSNAIAKYDYIDARGVPVKQIVRLPNDEHGNKRFRQRKWTDSGWVPNVKGIGSVLYNAHRLMAAGTVIIVEGEKDADSITNLHLSVPHSQPYIYSNAESRNSRLTTNQRLKKTREVNTVSCPVFRLPKNRV
jgi:hypothetical protein